MRCSKSEASKRIRLYFQTLKRPDISMPDYEFAAASYSRWAAIELIRYLHQQSYPDGEKILLEFMKRMEALSQYRED